MRKRFFVVPVLALLMACANVAEQRSVSSASTIIDDVRDNCTAGVAIDIPANTTYCADDGRATTWVNFTYYGPYFKTE